jgi:glycosyltransferase involved in cell wall biosynthesis
LCYLSLEHLKRLHQAASLAEQDISRAQLMVENSFHASIILNIYREAVYLRRTLLSLDEAVRFAHAKGLRLELVVVLDQSDDATREVLSSFDLGSYQGVQIIDVDHNSLGLSRNTGIKRARGEYIFTADSDDLVSVNYFHDIYATAVRFGSQALCFPEYVVGFGSHPFICRYEPLANVTPMTFVDQHPYISRFCTHRSVFDRIAYHNLRLSQGYAYEDWHFNAEAVGSGLDIQTVEGTIVFYRKRPRSLLGAFDALSVRQISPTCLFKPLTFLAVAGSYLRDPEQADRSRVGFNIIDRDFLSDTNFQAFVRQANAIEPTINLSRYFDQSVPVFRNHMGHSPIGKAYYAICDIVRDHTFSDVFLFPFMLCGETEKYFISLMEAMYRLDPMKEFLLIIGEDPDVTPWTDLLPPNVVVVDMGLHCEALASDERCLITLKIIETCEPGTRIHMRECAFADRFVQLYGVVLSEKETIYYRVADAVRVENGHLTVSHSSLGFIAENLTSLSRIICDSSTTIRNDQHRLGLQGHKWRHLPARVEAPSVMPVRDADASRRILWASRLDSEKRPSLLPLIAGRLCNRAPDASLEVFGGSVFNPFDRTVLEGIPNLHYRGQYKGFDALPLSRFSIFLYTSLHDGIPNVLLEAMSYGLAVVAPDVGGISEIVIHGETGILLPSLTDDDDMAASYTEALLALMDDPDLPMKLGRQARAFVNEHHSPEAHAKRVAELFQIEQRHFQDA